MSVSYISAKVEGSYESLENYIKEKYQNSDVKRINDSIVLLQFQGPPPYIDLVTPNANRGFSVVECSQIKDTDWKNDGFDIINKVETDDKVNLSPEERKCLEENENRMNEVGKYLMDTSLPNKARLNDKDVFHYLLDCNFLSLFVFMALFVVLMINLVSS